MRVSMYILQHSMIEYDIFQTLDSNLIEHSRIQCIINVA